MPAPPDTIQTVYNVSLQDVKSVGVPRLLAADQQLGGWSSLDDETQIALHWLMGGGSPDRFCGSERCAAAMRSAQEYVSEVQILLAAAMTFSAASAVARAPKPNSSGETSAARYGRLMHDSMDYGEGFVTELKLDNGMKVDAVNFEMRLALELKPNNPRAIAKGLRQLQKNLLQLELEYPT